MYYDKQELSIESTIPDLLNKTIKPLAIFCGCITHIVSDLVGRLPHDGAHM